MIFLFSRWDMLVPWRVSLVFLLLEIYLSFINTVPVLVEVAPPFFHNLARAQVIDELAKLAGVEAQVKDGVFGGDKKVITLSEV